MPDFLIDTHTLLWFIEDDSRLSDRVKSILTNDSINLSVSVVSLWEIVIKINIGKSKIGYTIKEIYQLLTQLNVEVLSIEQCDLDYYLTLPLHHRDPFDRLLIAQTINRGLVILSADNVFSSYEIDQFW